MKDKRLPALALAALLLAGCAPADPGPGSASGSAPPPDSSASAPPAVQVDWDRLESKEPLQPDLDGGRWFEEYTDRLIPGEEYGPLIPYIGSSTYATNIWIDDAGEEQRWTSPWRWSFYGLMTLEGKVVTDPVFTDVYSVSYVHEGETIYLPALLLTDAREEWADYANGQRYAVAARDGSWCTDFEFWNYTTRGEDLLLMGLEGLTRIHTPTGQRRDWSWDDLGMEDMDLQKLLDELIWGMGFTWTEGGVYLYTEPSDDGESAPVQVFQPDTGEMVQMTYSQWNVLHDQWFDQRQGPEPTFTFGEGDQVTVAFGDEEYTLTMTQAIVNMDVDRRGDFCIFTRYRGERQSWLFRLSDGTLLMEAPYLYFVTDQAGGPSCLRVEEEGGPRTIYTPELEPILSQPSLSCDLYQGRLSVWVEGSFFGCWDLEQEEWIFYRNLGMND